MNVNFEKGNMLELDMPERFDAVINIFYSFGFFEADAENEQVINNFYKALKPGGKFLMHTDVNVSRVISGQYKQNDVRHLANGKTLTIVDVYNSDSKRIEGSWIIKDKDGKEERKDYSVRVYTKDEFIELCRKVGFLTCNAYSDWQGSSYTEQSEDMIIVATK